jgi:succinate dehydrogenase / fumarate reductase iron-sulfur subunit
MKFKLQIWRQRNKTARGKFVTYDLSEISPDMSFLEMLDVLNEKLIKKNEEPVVFDHDCREGICGACGVVINGSPHGPLKGVTTCQLHMRSFKDGDKIVIEPFRAKSFPVLKDLMVDRSGFDRMIAAGGFISVSTGSAPDGNALPVRKENAELAMDAAACIGCGACVAACPNGSAMLFVSAKVAHLGLLPQGQPERSERVLSMVEQMQKEGFGHCTNHGECEAACPKQISVENIARLNRDFIKATLTRGRRPKRANDSAAG